MNNLITIFNGSGNFTTGIIENIGVIIAEIFGVNSDDNIWIINRGKYKIVIEIDHGFDTVYVNGDIDQFESEISKLKIELKSRLTNL